MIETIHTFQDDRIFKHIPFVRKDSVFFDIETTGFTPKNSHIYMIGAMTCEGGNTFCIHQYFNDDDDEASLLQQFFELAKNYEVLIHFNGNGFDLPFIQAKCTVFDLDNPLETMKSIDLYREAGRYKSFWKTENLKQKTLEQFFGLHREDNYSGGDLINVYYDYRKNSDPALKELLLLHNLEDLKGMMTLLYLYEYAALFEGTMTYDRFQIHDYTAADGQAKKEVYIDFLSDTVFPRPISVGNGIFFLALKDNRLTLRIPLYTGELKFFYRDYKNYYYLPKEDLAIHKSVAFYVDKEFRTQAKAATCYGRKSGQFLPEYDEVICPYFKKEYHDKVCYFEADHVFFENREQLTAYAKHVIEILRTM